MVASTSHGTSCTPLDDTNDLDTDDTNTATATNTAFSVPFPFVLFFLQWDNTTQKYTVPLISAEDVRNGAWDNITNQLKTEHRLHPNAGILPRGFHAKLLYSSTTTTTTTNTVDGVMIAQAVFPSPCYDADTRNSRWALPSELWNAQWISLPAPFSHHGVRPFVCNTLTRFIFEKLPNIAWSVFAPSITALQYPVPNCQYVVSSSRAEIDRWIGLGDLPEPHRFCVEEEIPHQLTQHTSALPSPDKRVYVARFAVWKEWEPEVSPVFVGLC